MSGYKQTTTSLKNTGTKEAPVKSTRDGYAQCTTSLKNTGTKQAGVGGTREGYAQNTAGGKESEKAGARDKSDK